MATSCIGVVFDTPYLTLVAAHAVAKSANNPKACETAQLLARVLNEALKVASRAQFTRLEILEIAYEAEKKLHAQILQLELKDGQLEVKQQRVLEQNSQLAKVEIELNDAQPLLEHRQQLLTAHQRALMIRPASLRRASRDSVS